METAGSLKYYLMAAKKGGCLPTISLLSVTAMDFFEGVRG